MLKKYFQIIFHFLMILIEGKTGLRFTFAAILGLAFSISVILSTIGIMDGFDNSLKSVLKNANGDIVIKNRMGSFNKHQIYQKLNLKQKKISWSDIVNAEGFIIGSETSRGVLIKGVDAKTFQNVTEIQFELKSFEVAVGKVLAEQLKLKLNDDVYIALAKKNQDGISTPQTYKFKLAAIVSHGLYKKDLKIIYTNKQQLSELIGAGDKIDEILIIIDKLKNKKINSEYLDQVKDLKLELEENIGYEFKISEFWEEYSPLLKAVKVEKFMISLILQIIVIISIFNVLAYTIYLREKNSQEIFLFQALGMNTKTIAAAFMILIIFSWGGACLLAYYFTRFFNLLLTKTNLFKFPGEIYNLSHLSLSISSSDYFLVYALSLCWIILISFFSILKLKKRSPIEGLKKEFI